LNAPPERIHPLNDPNDPAGALEFDFIEGVREVFEEKIVFNKVLGVKIQSIGSERVVAHIPMRPDLVGHFGYNRIHGGVISASLDALGGLAVLAAMGMRYRDEPVAQRLERFSKLGTIDLRVDYLRPGIGDSFQLTAEVLRLGSRVASTRMSFLDRAGKLLSSGSGTYIVA
jgi:uncharacterized protein (TIGR00369 family)